MAKVSVFTKFACQEGKGDEMEVVLRRLVAATSSDGGVETYSYHRGEGDTFWFFALMSSMEAAETHADNPEIAAAMPELMELLAGPPEMAMTTPIAAKGLPI